jgi:hypothetical protein
LEAETRYQFIKILSLSLYYACTKLRHYLLSSTYIVACQTDIIKHKLRRSILSGTLGKWAYILIEYDLAYEPLKSTIGQIIVNFIVEHLTDIEHDLEVDHIFYPMEIIF